MLKFFMKSSNKMCFLAVVRTAILFSLMFSCTTKEIDLRNVGITPIGNITQVSYKIKLHKINVYPSNCEILIDPYFSNDSVRFDKLAGAVNITLPVSDTVYNSSGFENNFYYLTWKVTGRNNDSLSGGKTSTLKMKAQATFEINY